MLNRLSAGDFVVREYEQRPQQRGGVAGAEAELVRIRQLFRWEEACSQTALSHAISLLTSFFALVSGLVWAAL